MLVSLVEVAAGEVYVSFEVFLTHYIVVGYLYIPTIHDVISSLRYGMGTGASLDLMETGIELTLVVSSFISYLFFCCDILNNHGKNIFQRYNFSAGLREPGQEWGFIFGQFTAKKRFRCISDLKTR